MAFQGFPEEGLQFLRDLRENNSKAWFDEHRADYATCCKEPMFDFVRGVGEGLKKIAPRMVADPRINGSVYRINRDIRFSKVKIPYKTNIASIFWPEGSAKHGAAGFYFHLEPEKVVIAGGVYAPEASALHAMREAIAKSHRKFHTIVTAPAFVRAFGALTGQALKRPPRGFDADHPGGLRRRTRGSAHPADEGRGAQQPVESGRLHLHRRRAAGPGRRARRRVAGACPRAPPR
ncbi:MAG: DUF2461 domain-containing protein, partial [Planctomycetes bacterium]|nr:DUF2461 domain-containing protein [Planctomycetota bacterium]